MGACCRACFERFGEAAGKGTMLAGRLFRVGVAVEHLAFSPGGRLLAAAGGTAPIPVWDMATREYCGELKAGQRPLWGLAWGPERELLYLPCQDRMLRIVRWPTGEEVQSLLMPQGRVQVAIAPNDRTLALAGEKGLEVWGRGRGEDLWTFRQELPRADCTAFSPDGETFAHGSGVDLALHRKTPETGAWERWGPKHGDARRAHTFVGFRPDGRTVVTAGGVATFLRDERGTFGWWGFDHYWRREQPVRPGLKDGVLSPDAEWLAARDGPGVYLMHLTHEWRTYALRARPTADVVSLAFSPDGRTLATGHADGAIQLWPWRRLVEW